jgi:hypothetical protein
MAYTSKSSSNEAFIQNLIFAKYPEVIQTMGKLQEQIGIISDNEKIDLAITIDSEGKKRNVVIHNGEEIYFEFGKLGSYSKA